MSTNAEPKRRVFVKSLIYPDIISPGIIEDGCEPASTSPVTRVENIEYILASDYDKLLQDYTGIFAGLWEAILEINAMPGGKYFIEIIKKYMPFDMRYRITQMQLTLMENKNAEK